MILTISTQFSTLSENLLWNNPIASERMRSHKANQIQGAHWLDGTGCGSVSMGEEKGWKE